MNLGGIGADLLGNGGGSKKSSNKGSHFGNQKNVLRYRRKSLEAKPCYIHDLKNGRRQTTPVFHSG